LDNIVELPFEPSLNFVNIILKIYNIKKRQTNKHNNKNLAPGYNDTVTA